MSAGRTELWDSPIVGGEDRSAQVALTAGQTNVEVLSFRTVPGLLGWLTSFGQAWDNAIDGYVTFSLEINGGRLIDLNGLTSQIASPAQCPQQELPEAKRLEQYSQIRVLASLSASAPSNGNFYTRVICKYQNPK